MRSGKSIVGAGQTQASESPDKKHITMDELQYMKE